MHLADVSAALRRQYVADALPFALAELSAPAGTYDLAAAIARHLRTDDRDDLSTIGRILSDMARTHEAACKSSETFRLYGKVMHRIIWRPVPLPTEAKPAQTLNELVRCLTCGARDFRHNMREMRCVACEWTV